MTGLDDLVLSPKPLVLSCSHATQSNDALFSVKDKNVVITGGAGGLGMMMASGYVRNGAKVIIASRKEKDLKAACDELNKLGNGSAEYIVADLSSKAGADGLAAEVKKRIQKLHVLVNNSGSTWGSPYESVDETKGWDRVFDLNVKGVFYLTVALTDLLAKDASNLDPGRVITIASIAGLDARTTGTSLAMPGYGLWSYYSSKAAAIHLTRTLATTLGPRFITANTICPGVFPSKMSTYGVSEHGDSMAANSPMKRIGTPPDMAGLALFLSSRASAHISGVEIPIDGGAYLSGKGFSEPPAKAKL